MQVTAKLESFVRYASLDFTSLAAHLPSFLQSSNDDHSYFVRWKLPTETLEVFDDNKWLRLSSCTIIHLAILNIGLDHLTEWPRFIGKELNLLSPGGNTYTPAYSHLVEDGHLPLKEHKDVSRSRAAT